MDTPTTKETTTPPPPKDAPAPDYSVHTIDQRTAFAVRVADTNRIALFVRPGREDADRDALINQIEQEGARPLPFHIVTDEHGRPMDATEEYTAFLIPDDETRFNFLAITAG